jgi:hypothetical protein
MAMITACPICLVDGRFSPVNRRRWSCEKPIESFELLVDVLSRLGAIDRYGMDRNLPVVWIDEVKNNSSFCGGEVRYWVGLLKNETGRTFGEYIDWIAISEHNGNLETAIPA